MTDLIKTTKLAGTWSVRAAGAIIVETTSAMELREGDYDPVIYFPRKDVALALMDKSEKSTHCPHKGDATYFSIQTKNGPIDDVAWSYETPHKDVSEIKEHIAFFPHEKIAVEEV